MVEQSINKQEDPVFKPDSYGGIVIKDMESLAKTEEEFRVQLKHWMEDVWPELGVRSVKVEFRAPKCHLMNVATEVGFYFHHASESGFVAMMLWTDKTCANRMPSYAHHYVGVGGCVVNQSGTKVLLVKTRRRKDGNMW